MEAQLPAGRPPERDVDTSRPVDRDGGGGEELFDQGPDVFPKPGMVAAKEDAGHGSVDGGDLPPADFRDRGRELPVAPRVPGRMSVSGRTRSLSLEDDVLPLPFNVDRTGRGGELGLDRLGRLADEFHPQPGLEHPGAFLAEEKQAPARPRVFHESPPEALLQPGRIRHDYERELPEPRPELMLGQDVDREAKLEQGVERPLQILELAPPRGENPVRLVPVGRGRKKQGDLGDGRALEARLLPGPAEAGQPLLLVDNRLDDPARPRRCVVDLEPAALHQDDGRFLHELDRRLEGPAEVPALGEPPGHQVPGQPRRGEVAGLDPGPVDRERPGVVAGEEIKLHRGRLRGERGVHPVASDLEAGPGGVKGVDPATEIGFEGPPVEVLPLEPPRVRAGARRVLPTRLFFPGGHGPGRVVELGGPTLAVDPQPVQVVGLRGLLELGDEEFVDVGTKDRGVVGVAVPLFVDPGPVGMSGDRLGVPDPRVMDIQADAELPGDFSPDDEAVLLDSRRGPADLGRIPGPAGVALAIVLDIIRPYAPEETGDHLLGDVGPEGRVGFVRMEVEVEPEEGVPAGEGGLGGGGEGEGENRG